MRFVVVVILNLYFATFGYDVGCIQCVSSTVGPFRYLFCPKEYLDELCSGSLVNTAVLMRAGNTECSGKHKIT